MIDKSSQAYYKMWNEFRMKYGSVFPNTWIELDWVSNWDFDLEKRFYEEHNLNTFRRRFLASLANYIANSNCEGDFIELGSYFGFGSYLMLENSNRNVHIVDSFQGLSRPAEIDGTFWSANDMKVERDVLENNLSKFSGRYTIHEGWIPEVLSTISKSNFAFAHIDLDLYHPTLHTLQWLSSKIGLGGLMLCDDYGFSTCPGATAACKQFESDSNEWRLLPLPVGGCLFLKS